MPGTLFVVATPIGNLEDITLRALRTLKEVDLIAAEDTRRTAKLLAHYQIKRPVMSLRAHTEAREAPRLLARLQAGDSIALVTDAGTPGISDPGSRLVRAVRDAGLPTVPIPGPSAVVAALSVSGFPADQFTFLGFPPASGRAREEWFAAAGFDPRTLVLFEAPHRVRRTLSDLKISMGERPIIILRELTKIHETLVNYHKYDTSEDIYERGEFTVVIGPQSWRAGDSLKPDHIVFMFEHMTNIIGLSEHDAFIAIGSVAGVRPETVRNVVKRANLLAKQRGQAEP